MAAWLDPRLLVRVALLITPDFCFFSFGTLEMLLQPSPNDVRPKQSPHSSLSIALEGVQ